MSGVRARGEDIRRFILEHVEKHPEDISKVAAAKFGITRQAVNKHLQRLTSEGSLAESGKTRARSYKVSAISTWDKHYLIVPGLEEETVWVNDIRPHLGQLPDNVMNIWHVGFTEMFNNAIEHSESHIVLVQIDKTAVDCEMLIFDKGVGIFKKIQGALNLDDPRHAILELAKGKFTTDPKHHSGEGIFFTSRMFDSFDISSRGVLYSHEFDKEEEWIIERPKALEGTMVSLKLHNHTSRTARKIYDQFASVEGHGFSKTMVPVRLAQYGNDQLVSRSQAKRLLSRLDRFRVVFLDFAEIPGIGQAFADEIFRVFQKQHPEIQLLPINANPEVKGMIAHALAVDVGLAHQSELPLGSAGDQSHDTTV
jgi:anti-sigma regulatory factor (Ser/Thr protein kinase)